MENRMAKENFFFIKMNEYKVAKKEANHEKGKQWRYGKSSLYN